MEVLSNHIRFKEILQGYDTVKQIKYTVLVNYNAFIYL
jgi:hypothetical protein